MRTRVQQGGARYPRMQRLQTLEHASGNATVDIIMIHLQDLMTSAEHVYPVKHLKLVSLGLLGIPGGIMIRPIAVNLLIVHIEDQD